MSKIALGEAARPHKFGQVNLSLLHIIEYYCMILILYGGLTMMTLPDQFCWTRFGTEASQTIDQILERKEQERLSNGGTFFWGIGNAVGPSMLELLRRNDHPEVIFSPIKSAARIEDTAPPAVAAWTVGKTMDGHSFRMPEHSLVTSRFDPAHPRTAHHALVCSSDEPLRLTSSDQKIDFGELRNLLTGRPVGASQVTSVVCRAAKSAKPSRTYDVALRVRLVAPFFVRLEMPVPLQVPISSACNGGDWAEAVRALWDFIKQSENRSQLTLPGITVSDRISELISLAENR